MGNTINPLSPLVSVIIPCYNHGKYLSKAIDSVIQQSYSHHEIIVVDDGSVDNTKSVCCKYPMVKYVHQENEGLSAARNMGIKHANGDYLVFLDADDWLLSQALEINLQYLKSNVNAAFVSGGHKLFYEPEDKSWPIQLEVTAHHYCNLLERNYIGMHATVMYRHWVFNSFYFNTSLRYCEDYDLFLKITRLHPVIHHTGLIAVYRLHQNNMSLNYTGMLNSALLVLSFQKNNLTDKAAKISYEKGLENWKTYYSEKIYDHLIDQLYKEDGKIDKQELKTLKSNHIVLFNKFQKTRLEAKYSKNWLLNILRKLYQKIKKKPKLPLVGKVNLGSLNRTQPFSSEFGYDRGGPIDRYYIENFLKESSPSIKGRVLEIGDNSYTLKFGGNKVTKSDILHIDDSNEQATFIGDLSNAPHIPSNTFDCIVLTQTLHLIYDFKGAIETCHRLLKQGGTLLITVPGISHIAQDEWGKYWLWSFTDASMQRIMGEHFAEDKISIKTYGNVLVASAFLYGMGLLEIKKEQLDQHDPHYQLTITVRAIK